MDNIKIGKYIADKRKTLGLTQRQLAEKLNMSDKSVSKWERGVCLPDASVYTPLCIILGISINELFAGEDIPQEIIFQKSEENIVGIVNDNMQKQNRLRTIIYGLVVLAILVVLLLCITVYREFKPQNLISPLANDSVEMQTAELFSGPNDAHIYEFTTTDKYKHLVIYISEYHAGELINKEELKVGFRDIDSPESGEILIVQDFENFEIKIVIATEGAQYSTAVPIMDGAADKEYYGRSSTEIPENTSIIYDEEQSLLALVYDNDIMSVPNLVDDGTDLLTENDYVYCFSFEFCK